MHSSSASAANRAPDSLRAWFGRTGLPACTIVAAALAGRAAMLERIGVPAPAPAAEVRP
jgi:hypothetical protein